MMWRVLMLSAVLVGNATGQGPVVETSYGRLRGQTLHSRSGREYSVFSRIPFAVPPVGRLRFKAPERYDGQWTEIYDGTKNNTPCAQSRLSLAKYSSEDCLYLEISTPNVNGSLPVMFSVFGGGFVGGYPGSTNSASFFMDEDVVIVNTNYRLGAFGFLDLGTAEISGNMGLKDQATALEWVQREIQNFGGNPKQITAFGISAGGMSAHFLCTAPRTRGLLKGCISQSGVGGSPVFLRSPLVSSLIGYSWALSLGCPIWDIFGCLRAKSTADLTTSIQGLFTPVIDGYVSDGFIPRWPANVSDFPWITGHTQNEGALVTGTLENFYSHELVSKLVEGYKVFRCLSPLFKYIQGLEWLDRLYERFFKNSDFFPSFERIVTEFEFIYPAFKSLSRHRGPKYFYKFNYSGGPQILEFMYHTKLNVTGVCHGNDSPYFINDDLYFPKPEGWPNQKDVQFSKTLIKLWVNFARDQKPSSDDTKPNWTQTSDLNLLFLDMNNNDIIMNVYKDAQDIMDFWDKMWFTKYLF